MRPTRDTKRAFPFVRRAHLARALSDAAETRRALGAATQDARGDLRAARQAAEDEKATLIASLVADYYRAWAACEDRPERRGCDDPFISMQHGIMDHAVTVLARVTGKDSITIGFALDMGLPVAGEARMPGDQHERQAALLAPYRQDAAGVYAHLAPERGGPAAGRQRLGVRS